MAAAKPQSAKSSKTKRVSQKPAKTAKPAKRVSSSAAATKAPASKQTRLAPKPTKAVTVGKVSKADAAHPHAAAIRSLREYGLTFPEAHLKSPWPEHLDLAVRDKTFAYLSTEGEPLRISCKLPQSASEALALSFTEPTPYGLGKSGWVSAKFEVTEAPPVEFLKAWIEESYRAQAPKTLVKQLA
jgi:predicted DNA-binding protein (MmcQ/YjbR family)